MYLCYVMKRIIFCIILMFAGIVSGSAQQKDKLEPGLYSVTGDGIKAMERQSAISVTSAPDTDMLLEQKFVYKGSEGINKADGNFLLVCDPGKKNPVVTLKKFNIFTKKLTPEDMMIIPLTPQKNKRIYDCRKLRARKGKIEWLKFDFTWEETSECTYSISADLAPGEYAIVFCYVMPVWNFDFNNAFTFTVE